MGVKKVKSAFGPMLPTRLDLELVPGWDASPSQG